jgi:hypothetical protein
VNVPPRFAGRGTAAAVSNFRNDGPEVVAPAADLFTV